MIPVIDVFAGPGGLNEGFARCNDGVTFSIAASFEMEGNAVETLKLRSAVRALSKDGGVYKPYREALNRNALLSARVASDVLRDDPCFQGAVAEADRHVFQHELSEATREELSRPVDGGCQAAWRSPPDSSGRSMSLPFSKRAPARTRATRWGAFTARQRAWAA